MWKLKLFYVVNIGAEQCHKIVSVQGNSSFDHISWRLFLRGFVKAKSPPLGLQLTPVIPSIWDKGCFNDISGVPMYPEKEEEGKKNFR